MSPVLGAFERLLHPAADVPPPVRAQMHRAYDRLAAETTLKRYQAEEVAARAGSPATFLCMIESGTMDVYLGNWDGDRGGSMDKDEERDVIYLRTLRAGDTWGEVGLVNSVLSPASLGNGRRLERTANVRAATPVVARQLTYGKLNELRKSQPVLNEIVLEIFAGLVIDLTSQVRDLRIPGEVRLRGYLIELARDAEDIDGWLDTSQSRIALHLGLGRSQVNRLLKAESAAGRVATRSGREGLLVDIERLEAQVRRDRRGSA